MKKSFFFSRKKIDRDLGQDISLKKKQGKSANPKYFIMPTGSVVLFGKTRWLVAMADMVVGKNGPLITIATLLFYIFSKTKTKVVQTN